MNQKTRLSDTEALVRQGIRPAEFITADEAPHPALGSADRDVQGSRPGRFRRETGAGTESLALGVKTVCGEDY